MTVYDICMEANPRVYDLVKRQVQYLYNGEHYSSCLRRTCLAIEWEKKVGSKKVTEKVVDVMAESRRR